MKFYEYFCFPLLEITIMKSNSKSNQDVRFRVQRNIAIASFLIFAGKLAAYFLTNSVGILTDALESTVNVTTGIITLYAVYVSIKPRDEKHPFGHGKSELLSASVEGLLIIIAGVVIIIEAVKRLFVHSEVSKLDVGIIIVALAGLVNYLLGWYSIRVGRKHNSIALVSGGKHLMSDTYSSIGLVLGLVLLYITKIAWLDSLIALIFGSIIIITGVKILKETTANLMDEADFELIKHFGDIIEANKPEEWIDIHNFRLTKYGDSLHIDCDLVLPYNLYLSEAHREGERLKQLLKENCSKDIALNVHTDECFKKYCQHCQRANCKERQHDFISPLRFDIKRFISEGKEV